MNKHTEEVLSYDSRGVVVRDKRVKFHRVSRETA